MSFVIDTSVAAAILLPDEVTPAAARAALFEHGAIAPVLLQIEVTNLLLISERRNRITRVEAGEYQQVFTQMPIVVEPALTPQQCADVLSLALRHRLTAYDAAYLELAVRKACPLATLDTELIAAARAEGVELVE